jgi:hypothetical protein
LVEAIYLGFYPMLKESVEETLGGVLGTNVSHALLHYVPLPSSSEELKDFQSALATVLGTGSAVVERLIVRDLYKRMGLTQEKDGDFERQILQAEKALQETEAR